MAEGDSEYWKQALIAGRKARKAERLAKSAKSAKKRHKKNQKPPKSPVSTGFVVRVLPKPSDPQWLFLSQTGTCMAFNNAEVFHCFEEAENLVLDNRSAHPEMQFRWQKA